MIHTPQCLERQTETSAEREAYLAKYPNACQKCGASGVMQWQENQSPLGSGEVWLETLSDYCPACFGHCPRCGVEISNPEEFYNNQDITPCSACGWTWGKQQGDTLTELWECDCWIVEDELPY